MYIRQQKGIRQKKGIATEGSICVQPAIVTVFSVLNIALYSPPDVMMKSVELLKRHVDDSTGLFVFSEREFRK